MGDKIYYARLIMKCFFGGIISLMKPSTWRWMSETKREEDFPWHTVIGIVFWNDYRLEKHYERERDY